MEQYSEEPSDTLPLMIDKISFPLEPTALEEEKELPFRFLYFHPSRSFVFGSFIFCFSLPSLIALASFGMSKFTIFLLIWNSLSGIALNIIYKKWEGKLKASVASLVKAKVEELKLDQLEEENRQFLEEMESVTAHNLFLQQENENLKEVLRASRRGYEHQIDLLQSAISKSKEELKEIHYQMEMKQKEAYATYLEREDLKKEKTYVKEEIHTLQVEAEKNLEKRETILTEYQKTIHEQRMVIEKKQRHIAHLESKIGDLTYEIRSLLHLEDLTPTPTLALDLSNSLDEPPATDRLGA